MYDNENAIACASVRKARDLEHMSYIDDNVLEEIDKYTVYMEKKL